MIPHPAPLDAAYGTAAWSPFTRVTLISPTAGGGETQIVADTVEGVLTSSDTTWPRDTLEMTIPAGVTPAATVAPVTPYGGRVRVEAGAILNGVRYTFQVRELDVTEVMIERPSGSITIRAASREATINEARFAEPVEAAGSCSFRIEVIARTSITPPGQAYYAPMTIVNTLTSDPTPAFGEFPFTEPWVAIQTLADVAGGEAWFRYDRALVLRDDPVIGSPVLTFKVGTGGTITDYRDITRWAFNEVNVLFTSNAGNTIVGKWQNTAGGSATRVAGPYGRHVRVENRKCATLPNQARADSMAASLAKRSAAPFRRVELDAVPAPWIEPGDTVAVQLQEGGTRNMLVSGVRWPLTQLDPMTVTMHDSGL